MPGEQYRRYGYLLLNAFLKNEGLVVNKKRTYLVYCEFSMQVRTKRRKKPKRFRVPLSVPTRPNERWSVEFLHDQLACGRRIRVVNIVDDYSRCMVNALQSRAPTQPIGLSNTRRI